MKKTILTCIFLFSFITFLNAQWVEQTSGVTTSLLSLSAVDDNVAWACGNSSRVVRTTNGGTSWAPVTNPGAGSMYNIFGVDANTALVTTSASSTTVWRTTNGGTSWTTVFTQSGGFIDAIWMTSATNGFMMGDPVSNRWSLWKTTNGGANWDSTGLFLAASADAGWNNGMMVLGTRIWFTSNGPRIYYSTNSGSNWSTQTVAAASSYSVLWFNSSLSGMAGIDANMVTTANSGTLWTPLATPPSGTQTVYAITGTGTTWFVIRAANIIHKSTTNGASWVTDYTAPTGTFVHMQKAINGNRLWATQSDGGISMSSQLMGVTPISGEIPTSFSLSQNYPNPFNPATKIDFALPKSSNVVLKVYNTLGKEVASIFSGFLSAGSYTADFNASELSSGIYFYTINSGDFTETKKMILVK